MPPERTDLERLLALQARIERINSDVERLRSDIKSVEGDVKAGAVASQVRSKEADEVYRVVMDDNEGLRSRVRSLEERAAEDEKLKAYVSGQIKTWMMIGSAVMVLVQILFKLWK